MLNTMRLRGRIFVPIGAVITVTVGSLAWYVVTTQTRRMEGEFQDRLQTLAATAPVMIHSGAEKYCEEHNLLFHRVLPEDRGVQNWVRPIGDRAFRAFQKDEKREAFIETTQDSLEWLTVFSPARIQPECRVCHQANGMTRFDGLADGTLVAAFGVSGPLDSLRAEESRMRWIAVGAAAALLFIIWLLVSRILNRVILLALTELVHQSDQVAQGDLRVMHTPTLDRQMHVQDEMGMLVRAFAGMINGLRDIIRQVRESADDTATAGDAISSTTEQLAAGAMEQSSQTNEVATAVEEMSQTIAENSRNAGFAAETARKAGEYAQRGGQVVTETVQSMERIAAVVRSSAETVGALSVSSRRIGDIAGIIDDIADQTNLLALNAAIEAARAGDQGRGFAVVADEVRKLADRTTHATKEIADTIRKIQVETDGAIEAMGKGTREVESGINAANRAGEALRGIVQIANEVADVVNRIAAASGQQSSTAEEIAKSILAINTVSHQSANGTQQIARSAEDLRQLTSRLKEIVGNFILSDLAGSPGSPAIHPAVPNAKVEFAPHQS